MREGRFDYSIIRSEAGQFIGFCLGYDYAAEHEWGIKRLRSDFGMGDIENSELLGFENRRVKCVPSSSDDRNPCYKVVFGAKGDDGIIGHGMYTPGEELFANSRKSYAYHKTPSQFRPQRSHDFVGAWTEQSFLIYTFTKEATKFLRELNDAFLAHDVCIWLPGKNNPFGGTGLCIGIYSRIPTEAKEIAREADADRFKLLEAAKKTGIEDRLKTAKREFFALSPRWKDDSKTEVIFWLNPMEQDKNNFGWYTVADLDAWIEGEGPIPIIKVTQEPRRKRGAYAR